MNKTKERRRDDELEECVRKVTEGYRRAAGHGLSEDQARQLLAKFGQDRILEKLQLLGWQRQRGGFTNGPLPYLLAALAGDWPPPPLAPEGEEGSVEAAHSSPLKLAAVLDSLSEADRLRIEKEVSAELADRLPNASIPPFVVRTELLRRLSGEGGLAMGNRPDAGSPA